MYHMYKLTQQPEDSAPPALTAFSWPRVSGDASWDVLWWAFLLYLLVDLLWITVYPNW